MQYFTVKAPDYESAVRKIREKYGDLARIHSKKSISGKGLFRKKEYLEVTGYLLTKSPETWDGTNEQLNEESQPYQEGMDAVMKEINQLKTELKAAIGSEQSQENDGEDALRRISSILEDNDFSRPYIRYITENLVKDFPEKIPDDNLLLESKVIGYINDSIHIDAKHQKTPPGRMAVLGPTGVGKTTTIAKIAALHGLLKTSPGDNRDSNLQHDNRVSIVTIDNYRIGARHQIETFGDIMSIPVSSADSPVTLDQFLRDKHVRSSELVLIDTIGKSPKDQDIYDEMQRILSVCGSDTVFALALAASMKYADMVETIERFKPFRISTLIITKLDETSILGNIVSIAHHTNLPILYLATGQKVPQDLLHATKGYFLRKLKNFTVDVEHLDFGTFDDAGDKNLFERLD